MTTGTGHHGSCRLRVAGGLILAFVSGTPAAAADLPTLTNVLAPFYLAHHMAAVCTQYDPGFLDDTRRLFGPAPAVIKHVTEEVSAALPPDDATTVISAAAGAARTVALGMVRVLAGPSDLQEEVRLKRWCAETATPFVRGVVAGHEDEHGTFLNMLADAKRP